MFDQPPMVARLDFRFLLVLFSLRTNRQSFAAVAEAFLAQHLGGRREPIGDGFDGSTITFSAGRDLIPLEN